MTELCWCNYHLDIVLNDIRCLSLATISFHVDVLSRNHNTMVKRLLWYSSSYNMVPVFMHGIWFVCPRQIPSLTLEQDATSTYSCTNTSIASVK